MPKIETTRNVSLNLTRRINLRKRDACVRRTLVFGHSPQADPTPYQPPARKGLNKDKI